MHKGTNINFGNNIKYHTYRSHEANIYITYNIYSMKRPYIYKELSDIIHAKRCFLLEMTENMTISNFMDKDR